MAPSEPSKARALEIADRIHTIVSEIRDPAQLLELHYWTTDTRLLAILRGLTALPKETLDHFATFLHATDPASLVAEIDDSSGIRLVPRRGRRSSKISANPHASESEALRA